MFCQGSEVTGEVLRSLMKGLSLHLPRLTSEQALDSTCGSNGRSYRRLVELSLPTQSFHAFHAICQLCVKNPSLSMLLLFGLLLIQWDNDRVCVFSADFQIAGFV